MGPDLPCRNVPGASGSLGLGSLRSRPGRPGEPPGRAYSHGCGPKAGSFSLRKRLRGSARSSQAELHIQTCVHYWCTNESTSHDWHLYRRMGKEEDFDSPAEVGQLCNPCRTFRRLCHVATVFLASKTFRTLMPLTRNMLCLTLTLKGQLAQHESPARLRGRAEATGI